MHLHAHTALQIVMLTDRTKGESHPLIDAFDLKTKKHTIQMARPFLFFFSSNRFTLRSTSQISQYHYRKRSTRQQ